LLEGLLGSKISNLVLAADQVRQIEEAIDTGDRYMQIDVHSFYHPLLCAENCWQLHFIF